MDKATESKTAIEDAQRAATKEREEKGETWSPKYFVAKGEKFLPKVEALPEAFRDQKVVDYFQKL